MFSTMKHAKKMQLVEYREPCAELRPINIYTKPARDEDYSAPTVLQNLDDEMGSILSNTTIDAGQKWLLYEQALGRYLRFIKRTRQHPSSNNEAYGNTTYDSATNDSQPDAFADDLIGLQFQEHTQQQNQQQGAIPKLKQQRWRGTEATKKMMTRKNTEPWDLVSPLHTPKRKKNTDRKIPYKPRYKKSVDDNARSEVSNRRNNNFDSARGAFNDDDVDMSFNVSSSHYPFASSNIATTRTSPTQSRQELPLIRPCSVRLENGIKGWLQPKITK